MISKILVKMLRVWFRVLPVRNTNLPLRHHIRIQLDGARLKGMSRSKRPPSTTKNNFNNFSNLTAALARSIVLSCTKDTAMFYLW